MKLELKMFITETEINEWDEEDVGLTKEEIVEQIHDWVIDDIQMFIQDTDVEMIIE